MVQRAAVDRHRSGHGPAAGSDHEPADRPRPLTDSPARRGPPRDARERWNHRYRQRGIAAFTHGPSSWLAEQCDLLTGPPGRRALDIACGDGRNAGYLAAQFGFEVDAVDVSDVAVEALRAAAAERGIAVNVAWRDLEASGLPAGPYDLIVQIHYLQRDLFGPIAEALGPGGLLVLETFT
ncbi:MAG TPA: methyltransferase domain-containing protein, partial [Solirubrobacteraceae bacterium]|nr:methyltransferase domain-containing protein [Solirubrobacteraceae bacterium]